MAITRRLSSVSGGPSDQDTSLWYVEKVSAEHRAGVPMAQKCGFEYVKSQKLPHSLMSMFVVAVGFMVFIKSTD